MCGSHKQQECRRRLHRTEKDRHTEAGLHLSGWRETSAALPLRLIQSNTNTMPAQQFIHHTVNRWLLIIYMYVCTLM